MGETGFAGSSGSGYAVMGETGFAGRGASRLTASTLTAADVASTVAENLDSL